MSTLYNDIIIDEEEKRIGIELTGSTEVYLNTLNLPRATNKEPKAFDSTVWDKIYNNMNDKKVETVIFYGDDAFDVEYREDISKFCKGIHEDERILDKEIWAHSQYTYKRLKSFKKDSIEELLDQIDVLIEPDGSKVDLGKTEIACLFDENANPIYRN